MNVFITGANRGIGLGFVQHFLAQGATVWAGCRDLGNLPDISSTSLHWLQWDVVSPPSDDELDSLNLPSVIDLLINNAGIYGPKKSSGQSLTTVDESTMLKVFDVVCVGTLRTTQLLLDKVINAQGTIANISSKMGSSADNGSGGCYAYRAAKASVVICSKSMAIDLEPKGVSVITLHPGWVRTDMTEHNGLIDVKTSVAGMINVINNLENYQLGDFVAFDGQVIPF